MQVTHLSNSFGTGKQSSIDGFGALECSHVNNQIDQGIEVGDRATIVNFGMFNP
jgi:nucleoid DNA-binding protein